MMLRSAFVVAAMAGTVLAGPADPYSALRERATKIIGNAYDGKVLAQLAELSESVGGRLTAAPSYGKAVAWSIAQLKAAGAQNVHTEMFSMAHGWQRGPARAKVVRPGSWSIRIESLGWAPSTRKGGVRGPVVIVKSLEALPADVKGKVVVVDTSEDSGALKGVKRWVASKKAFAAFGAGGALAVLLVASHPNQVLGTGAPTSGGEVLSVPAAYIGLEDGKRIQRELASGGSLVVEVDISNTITGPVQVANVVGELPGTSKEWLLIGAHLDSWDFATGSQDNGSGVVQVVQAARLLASAGPFERGIRFALWGGEEQGLNGSFAYVAAHEAELASCVLTLNTDNGAGHVVGWKVEGRSDVKAALATIADGLLAPLGAKKLDMTLTSDTDHFPFVVAGVPSLDLLVEEGGYDGVHHKVGDTIDKVDAHALASGLAVIAVTALAVATTRQPFAPRLDRAAVEKLLESDAYVELMKLDGRWK